MQRRETTKWNAYGGQQWIRSSIKFFISWVCSSPAASEAVWEFKILKWESNGWRVHFETDIQWTTLLFPPFISFPNAAKRIFVGQTDGVSTSGLSTSLHIKLNINHLPKGNYFIPGWIMQHEWKIFDKVLCNSERSEVILFFIGLNQTARKVLTLLSPSTLYEWYNQNLNDCTWA